MEQELQASSTIGLSDTTTNALSNTDSDAAKMKAANTTFQKSPLDSKQDSDDNLYDF
jgi:hypothetical protein